MAGGNGSGLQIVRLTAESVICQFEACEKPAEFLLKATDQVRALCKEHISKLGIRDKDLPSKNETKE